MVYKLICIESRIKYFKEGHINGENVHMHLKKFAEPTWRSIFQRNKNILTIQVENAGANTYPFHLLKIMTNTTGTNSLG